MRQGDHTRRQGRALVAGSSNSVKKFWGSSRCALKRRRGQEQKKQKALSSWIGAKGVRISLFSSY